MTKYEALVHAQAERLRKAVQHLQYSYDKVSHLSEDIAALDEESLETWESFAARFARVTDIFLMQYLRSVVLMNDPGFSGSLRDFVNQGAKLGVIDDVECWMGIRELRNIAAHEYSERDLSEFFKRLKMECPRLLRIPLIA